MKMTARTADSEPSAATAQSAWDARLLQRLLRALGDPPIAFHLAWNGERVFPDKVRPVHEVRIATRRTLLRLVLDTQMAFGDGFSSGDIEVSGDLVDFMLTVFRTPDHLNERESPLVRALGHLNARRRSSVTAARDNIHRHYDIGNEFYALWLGETMAYTCAYYPTAAVQPRSGAGRQDGPRVPQAAARRRAIRSSRPDAAGEASRCTWPATTARKVRAFNISREQIEFARARAREQRPGGTRSNSSRTTIATSPGSYDVFVSVGMLEHVGRENYPELGRVVRRSLTPTGRGLIHSIGRNHPGRCIRGSSGGSFPAPIRPRSAR